MAHSSAVARSAQTRPTATAHPSSWRPLWDVIIVGLLAVVAAIVALVLPDGSSVRFALTLPVLLVAPGYLLIQALVVPRSRPSVRFVHGLLSLGVSPAIVGLLALLSALFRVYSPTGIIVFVTLWCIVMAGLAVIRGTPAPRAGSVESPRPSPAAQPADE